MFNTPHSRQWSGFHTLPRGVWGHAPTPPPWIFVGFWQLADFLGGGGGGGISEHPTPLCMKPWWCINFGRSYGFSTQQRSIIKWTMDQALAIIHSCTGLAPILHSWQCDPPSLIQGFLSMFWDSIILNWTVTKSMPVHVHQLYARAYPAVG